MDINEYENRIINPQNLSADEEFQEVKLRPQNFDEYIGQKKIIQNIEMMVQSAKARDAAIDHILLSGPPGLGKTSLAMLIAKEVGSQMHLISGPAIEKKGDLAAILTNLKPKDVLFIDEIHRMHISVEEMLYSAIEDFRLDILIGQGPSARAMKIDLVPFTLIGATTKAGLLSNPLRDRFIANFHFDYYQPIELAIIVKNNQSKLKIKMSEEGINEIAKRSRGTPRIANRILRRVRDFGVVKKLAVIDLKAVQESLLMLDINQYGLDHMDRKILKIMREYYQGGPVGIDALASTLAEDRETIEEVYEPYLLKEGFIIRTPRGRVLSQKGQEVVD